MLISFYEKNKRKDKKKEDDSYDKRINKIQLELKEIVGWFVFNYFAFIYLCSISFMLKVKKNKFKKKYFKL